MEATGQVSDVQVLMDSLSEAFVEMSATLGLKIEMKAVDVARRSDGIVASCSLQGDSDDKLALGLSAEAAATLAKRFTGCAFSFESESMDDVVGEILNVVAGSVESKLKSKGIRVRRSVPETVRGGTPADFHPVLEQGGSLDSGSVWLWCGASPTTGE